MTDHEIRPATPDDAPGIRNLVRAAYAKWTPVIGREARPINADYEHAVREHDIDVLYVDGAIVGVLEVVIYPSHLWLENVAVAPEHQGKGWGRRLLDLAEHKAMLADRAAIHLLTNGAFEANVALYKSIGYNIDKTEPFMGGTAVYMSKRLAI